MAIAVERQLAFCTGDRHRHRPHLPRAAATGRCQGMKTLRKVRKAA